MTERRQEMSIQLPLSNAIVSKKVKRQKWPECWVVLLDTTQCEGNLRIQYNEQATLSRHDTQGRKKAQYTYSITGFLSANCFIIIC